MPRPGSSIFRSKALEQYIRTSEKAILPCITRPLAFLCIGYGYEVMHMIRKGQLQGVERGNSTGQITFIAGLFGVAT